MIIVSGTVGCSRVKWFWSAGGRADGGGSSLSLKQMIIRCFLMLPVCHLFGCEK